MLYVYEVEFFQFGDTDYTTVIAKDEAEVYENYFGTIVSVNEVRIASEDDISKYSRLTDVEPDTTASQPVNPECGAD